MPDLEGCFQHLQSGTVCVLLSHYLHCLEVVLLIEPLEVCGGTVCKDPASSLLKQLSVPVSEALQAFPVLRVVSHTVREKKVIAAEVMQARPTDGSEQRQECDDSDSSQSRHCCN